MICVCKVRALRAAYPKQIGVQADNQGNLLEITTCHEKVSTIKVRAPL